MQDTIFYFMAYFFYNIYLIVNIYKNLFSLGILINAGGS